MMWKVGFICRAMVDAFISSTFVSFDWAFVTVDGALDLL